jgi:phage terminase Nu1 subunit (DNA packaging protein)
VAEREVLVTDRPIERYVDIVELAAIMAVSERTIKRWVAEGMPSETWGLRRTRRYLPSRAIEWAHRRDTMAAARGQVRKTPGESQPKE